MSVNEKMTAIADAIRSKTGSTDKLGLDAMATAVDDVYITGHLHGEQYGYQRGGEEGTKIGYAIGKEDGYTEGKQAEYDRFWANFLKGINDRNTWECAFAGSGWNNDTFYPTFDIVPTGIASFMFRFFNFRGDLVERLNECGVKLDCSKITQFYYTFYLANFSRIGEIDTRSATIIQSIFGECYNLVTVDKLILKGDGSQQFISPFGYDNNLKNLTIEGVIGKNFPIGDCKNLTHDSLMSIINALKNYAGSGTTYTVTLGTTNLAKLTDAEKAIATGKGWTLA